VEILFGLAPKGSLRYLIGRVSHLHLITPDIPSAYITSTFTPIRMLLWKLTLSPEHKLNYLNILLTFNRHWRSFGRKKRVSSTNCRWWIAFTLAESISYRTPIFKLLLMKTERPLAVKQKRRGEMGSPNRRLQEATNSVVGEPLIKIESLTVKTHVIIHLLHRAPKFM
jgi:hypothetical protein